MLWLMQGLQNGGSKLTINSSIIFIMAKIRYQISHKMLQFCLMRCVFQSEAWHCAVTHEQLLVVFSVTERLDLL